MKQAKLKQQFHKTSFASLFLFQCCSYEARTKTTVNHLYLSFMGSTLVFWTEKNFLLDLVWTRGCVRWSQVVVIVVDIICNSNIIIKIKKLNILVLFTVHINASLILIDFMSWTFTVSLTFTIEYVVANYIYWFANLMIF